MRKLNATFLIYSLAASLMLVCFATSERCPIPFPVVVMGVLGVHAAVLLIEHREKLSDVLGGR